jgi:hypothetical protein
LLYASKSIAREDRLVVESRCGAVALGSGCLLPPLSSGGAQVPGPSLRLHTPLIEPDVRSYRIRLSDKTSRLRQRWPRKSGHGDKWTLCDNPSGLTPGKAEGP